MKMQKALLVLLTGSILLACDPENKLVTTPTVFTGKITEITAVSAIAEGKVTRTGGADVMARGICWGTSKKPTTDNNTVVAGEGLGTFTGQLTNLSPESTYYVRAFATNSEGTSYGKEESFKTLASKDNSDGSIVYGSLTDQRDGMKYKTVIIGQQEWMAENLRYLPSVHKPSDGNTTGSFYYVFGYEGTDVAKAKNSDNYKTYGVLYNWPAAMAGAETSKANPSGVQGVCPKGWHLPSDAEWTQIADYLGGDLVAGAKMKESGTDHWNFPNEDASNSSGFTALPGGCRYEVEPFNSLGKYGYWWSSTEFVENENYAWAWMLGYDFNYITSSCNFKDFGYSVRCVRD
ncbi:MAG: FISUMP domain-containing protein [Bacteroidales bacterium]